MPRLAVLHLTALLIAVVATGCLPRSFRDQGGNSREKNASPAGNLVDARPDPSEPNVKALESYDASTVKTANFPGPYRILNASEIRHGAALNCPLANVLCAESQLSSSGERICKSSQRSAEVLKSILAYRAAGERNQAAGQAMELFYLLAEAESNKDLAQQSKEKIDNMLESVKDLQGQGIRLEKGSAELQQQKLQVLGREAELGLSIEQLNSRLRQLLGIASNDLTPIWPAADLTVTVEPIDLEAAVREGLAHRAEIGLLCTLSQNISEQTLPAVQSSLAANDAMLGAASPSVPCLLKGRLSQEIGVRRAQLNELSMNQERTVAEDVRLSVLTLETRLRQISIAQAKVDACQAQVESLRMQREKPGSSITSLDIGAAELQLLDKRGELIHQVIAWRIAQVKLKEAQGLLGSDPDAD